eukprot:6485091-Amphidinium_carterae.3
MKRSRAFIEVQNARNCMLPHCPPHVGWAGGIMFLVAILAQGLGSFFPPTTLGALDPVFFAGGRWTPSECTVARLSNGDKNQKV